MEDLKEKIPWCPHCNLPVYPEGDPKLKHTIIPVWEKYPHNITFRKPSS